MGDSQACDFVDSLMNCISSLLGGALSNKLLLNLVNNDIPNPKT
jgi:hypothetical protein